MTDAELIEKLSAIYDELTDILLERTPEDANWEDCEPEIDNARDQIFQRREELCRQGKSAMNWDDPKERFDLIERVGPAEYNRLHAEHLRKTTVETVNGYDIRTLNTRFGTLYHVDGTESAFPNLEKARAYAEHLETKS